jgi:lysophospholipase L1-like esterase
MGTNDWGYNMPIDPPKTKDEEDDLAVFRTAYSTMLRKIKKNYPKAEVWCITLAFSDSMRDFGFTLPFTTDKTAMSEYCQAIRDCAKENGCRLIDIFDAENAYETMDDLHPNFYGMKTIADLVLSRLEE